MPERDDIIIGIDLGTTNSLVAWSDASGAHVIRGADGDARVPSVLAFNPDGNVVIGLDAKLHAVEHPTSTVFSIKRLMGRGFDELQAAGELAHLPYQVVKRVTDAADRDIAAVDVNGRLMTPPEISAIILRELKRRAEAHLQQPISRVVITVPAYFDDAQRQATRDAGRIAGIDVVRIVNEPTAAALAYGLGIRGRMADEPRSPSLKLAGACASSEPAVDRATPAATEADAPDLDADAVIAVYDLGGGTFDVSVLKVVDGVFEVLSTHGDTCLGGDDFDREITNLALREIRAQFDLDIASPATRQALRTFAENVKTRLSTEPRAAIEIDLGAGRRYQREISREEFEAMIAPWVEKTLVSCRRALADAKIRPERIDQVVMVGGSTRIPLVRRKVGELFRRTPWARPCRRASSPARAATRCCWT